MSRLEKRITIRWISLLTCTNTLLHAAQIQAVKYELVPSVGYLLHDSNEHVKESPVYGAQFIVRDGLAKGVHPYVSLYGTSVAQTQTQEVSDPYIAAATVGIYKYFPHAFDTDWIMPVNHIGLSYVHTRINDQEVPKNNAALSYGLGVQMPLSDRLGLKLEVLGILAPKTGAGVATNFGLAAGLVIAIY